MLAVYDLAVSPPTYDFIGFLVSAERRRIRSGHPSITVAIVRGPNNGFREDGLPPHDPALRRKMLDNIVKPMCALLPSCTQVIEVARDEAAAVIAAHDLVFPSGYKLEAPNSHYGTEFFVKSARAHVLPLTIAGNVKEEGLVVISLRQSHYWPTRNSNAAEWVKAARVLQAQDKRVVFVPDADGHGAELQGFEVDADASTDLLRRARLCASAELVLSVNNGPIWMLAMMPQVSSIIFKMEAPDAPCVNAAYFASHGLPVGTQLDRPNHKIVWADDDAETILAAIEAGFGSASSGPLKKSA